MTEIVEWAPDACTLPVPERPLRAAEFTSLFASSLRAVERLDETHLRLTLSGDERLPATVADLVVRETACCSFFEFTVDAAPDGLRLDVAVPTRYVDVLDGLARQAGTAAGIA